MRRVYVDTGTERGGCRKGYIPNGPTPVDKTRGRGVGRQTGHLRRASEETSVVVIDDGLVLSEGVSVVTIGDGLVLPEGDSVVRTATGYDVSWSCGFCVASVGQGNGPEEKH